MPAKPEPVWRNIDLEREITYEACRGAVDPSQLIEHAEVRAQTLSGKYVDDSMKILLGRDRPREAREEAADARNHIVIHLQECPDDPLRDRYIIALRFFALAYSWLLPD